MRLICICNEFPPFPKAGGIGSAVNDLAGSLSLRGVEVVVVGIYPASYVTSVEGSCGSPFPGCRIVRIKSSFSDRFFQIQAIRDRLRLRRYILRLLHDGEKSVVLTDDFEGMLPFGLLARAPIITRLNGSNYFFDTVLRRDGTRLFHRFERMSLRQSRAWVGVSNFVSQECRNLLRPSKKIVHAVIPNGVNTDFFRPVGAVDLLRRGRILFHNTVTDRKGIFDLIAALPEVFREVPESYLDVYGKNNREEEIRVAISSQIPRDWLGRIRFHGQVKREEVRDALERAHVACYPSHLETFGIAPVEAMAMKRITVYTDTGPGREIIDEGVTGLLCPPRDPAKLADTLIRALKMPDAERLAMGEAARAAAVARFDREVVADRYLELFHRLLDHP